MLTRHAFILVHEALLVFNHWGSSGRFIVEAQLDEEMSKKVACELMCQDMDEYRALRVDLNDLTVEDVTDDLAAHWIEAPENHQTIYEYRNDPEHGLTLPAFVLNSDKFKEDIA